MHLEPFCLYWLFDSSEGKMELHNYFLKFDFAYIMVFLWQYSKKNYRKIPKSSKIYIKCHILNCLGFNNYWILLHKINFHWRISMSVNIFPLEVFDFCVLLSSITNMVCNILSPCVYKKNCDKINLHTKSYILPFYKKIVSWRICLKKHYATFFCANSLPNATLA